MKLKISSAKWWPFCGDPNVLPYWVHHNDVTKWKHFVRYWSFVRGIHRSPVNSPHKGQWRGALMFSLICAWINSWVNNRESCDLRCHCAHYDVIVMVALAIFSQFMITWGLRGKTQNIITLQLHHNGHDGVSNHQPYDCLLKRLFRRRSKKTSKLRVTGLCGGNSPVILRDLTLSQASYLNQWQHSLHMKAALSLAWNGVRSQ